MTATPETVPPQQDATPAEETAVDTQTEDRVVELEAEVAKLKDQVLRALAEAENTRRRAERDREDATKYGVTALARDLLSVSDNLRRALEAVNAEEADEATRNLLTGIEATEREMQAAMERRGIKRIEPLGEVFDPNFHQAMFEVPNPDVPSGTVVQVVQSGYSIGDRVLRPAMVGVARGGPKAAANDAPAEPGPVNSQAEKDA